jgi:large subunit ribosomal protein L30e
MTLEKEIKEAVKERKVFIGSRIVLKAAKTGRVKSVIYASNTPRDTLRDIYHYAETSGIKPQEFPGSSVQLGELCGKPFSILLLGITK